MVRQLLDDGVPDAAPWWIKFIARFGVTTLIAVLLLIFVLRNVSGAMTETNLKLDSVSLALTAHVSDMKLDAQRNQYLLRSICLNTAASPAQIANCEAGR